MLGRVLVRIAENHTCPTSLVWYMSSQVELKSVLHRSLNICKPPGGESESTKSSVIRNMERRSDFSDRYELT